LEKSRQVEGRCTDSPHLPVKATIAGQASGRLSHPNRQAEWQKATALPPTFLIEIEVADGPSMTKLPATLSPLTSMSAPLTKVTTPLGRIDTLLFDFHNA
jgi:hypothetical protein